MMEKARLLKSFKSLVYMEFEKLVICGRYDTVSEPTTINWPITLEFFGWKG